jgi:hypothetical protein
MPYIGPDSTVYPHIEMENGIPAKITVTDFRRYLLAAFPKLAYIQYDGLIQDVIDTVYAMFPGVGTLWDLHRLPVWYDKTVLCYRLLTAWYLADCYPMYVAGVPIMGGVPLRRKKIDGVDLTFVESHSGAGTKYQDSLESLKSNPWGVKAYVMLKASAKRVMLRNCTHV